MSDKRELLTKGDEVFLLTEEGETVSLTKAVGITAISIYDNLNTLSDIKDEDEKRELERKISLQSQSLSAMSKALTAIRPYLF